VDQEKSTGSQIFSNYSLTLLYGKNPIGAQSLRCQADLHLKRTVAAKPTLVQITTALGKPAEGSPVVPRNQYFEIRQEKPKNEYQQDAPEFKTCKYTTEAIVADGTDKGEFRKVCANPDCPVHYPKKQRRRTNADAPSKRGRHLRPTQRSVNRSPAWSCSGGDIA
jgi:hypothetical protein